MVEFDVFLRNKFNNEKLIIYSILPQHRWQEHRGETERGGGEAMEKYFISI